MNDINVRVVRILMIISLLHAHAGVTRKAGTPQVAAFV